MSKTLGVIADAISSYKAQQIVKVLQDEGISISYLGNIALKDEIDSDFKITMQLQKIMQKNEDKVLIGISIAGNSISIYSNKIEGFVTAPINEIQDIETALKIYKCNSFDICVNNPKINEIIIEIYKIMEK